MNKIEAQIHIVIAAKFIKDRSSVVLIEQEFNDLREPSDIKLTGAPVFLDWAALWIQNLRGHSLVGFPAAEPYNFYLALKRIQESSTDIPQDKLVLAPGVNFKVNLESLSISPPDLHEEVVEPSQP
jgi:hypothetical protein